MRRFFLAITLVLVSACGAPRASTPAVRAGAVTTEWTSGDDAVLTTLPASPR